MGHSQNKEYAHGRTLMKFRSRLESGAELHWLVNFQALLLVLVNGSWLTSESNCLTISNHTVLSTKIFNSEKPNYISFIPPFETSKSVLSLKWWVNLHPSFALYLEMKQTGLGGRTLGNRRPGFSSTGLLGEPREVTSLPSSSVFLPVKQG